MRVLIPAVTLFLALSSAGAFAQANLRPDPTPRLPAQAGQGLPAEDRAFLGRALNLSEAEIQAARLTEKADAPALREFGKRLADKHQELRQALQQLAQKTGASLQPHQSRSWWEGELQRIGALKGQDFSREYLRWQLQTHLALVDLYQTQASHSPEMELSKFAITSLTEIQRLFDQAKRLGADQGIAIDTVKQPPQY